MEKYYTQKNNIFQSKIWGEFQKNLGRNEVKIKDNLGYEIPIMLGKSFVWFYKGPEKVDRCFLDELKRVVSRKVIFARVEPNQKTKFGVSPLFLNGQASPHTTRVIDLSQDEDKILSQMKSRVRYNIRLAERKGVSIKTSSDPSDIDKFYKILKSTESRDRGFSAHEKKYYQNLFETLAKNKAGELVFGYYEGKIIYAGMYSFFGDTAVYLHSGFCDEYAHLKAPNYCLWQVMLAAKKNGAKYFDLWGITDSENPKHPWYGISKFKESFGGDVVHFAGTRDIVFSKFWYYLFTILANSKKIIRR